MSMCIIRLIICDVGVDNNSWIPYCSPLVILHVHLMNIFIKTREPYTGVKEVGCMVEDKKSKTNKGHNSEKKNCFFVLSAVMVWIFLRIVNT